MVIAHPQEPTLSAGACATSGKFASLRGLPAVSSMAERMGLDRDIALVEMTGVRYHADQITTARALPALERGKANGLDVTAGISIHHLTLNDMDVADYRTFFKLTPPCVPKKTAKPSPPPARNSSNSTPTPTNSSNTPASSPTTNSRKTTSTSTSQDMSTPSSQRKGWR